MATNPGTELSSLNFGNMIGGPLCAVIEAQTMAARATADFIKTVGFDKDNKPVYVEFKYPKEVAPYQPAVPAHVTGVTMTNQGAGYDSANPPAVTFAAAAGETAAQAQAVVEDGKVVRIELTDSGTYKAATVPAMTIAAPTGAGATQAQGTVQFATKTAAVEARFQEMKIEVPILTILPIPFIRVEEATIDFNAKINSIETQSQSSDLAIGGSLEVKQRWPGGSAKLNVSCSYQKKTASGSSVERTYSMHIYVKASQDEMPAGMERLLGVLEGAMRSTPVGEAT
jgi:hypothetical protein